MEFLYKVLVVTIIFEVFKLKLVLEFFSVELRKLPEKT